jgi:hypothetical protein
MKKSKLKEYIKEQIVKMLSEASPEEVQNQKELNKELEKTVQLSKQMEMGLKEEDEEMKDDWYKSKDEDDIKPVDAPAGDKNIQKKATKQDIIIKTYKDLNQILQRYRTAYDNAKNETDKQEAFQLLKKFSQSQEWKDAKEKYAKITNIKL